MKQLEYNSLANWCLHRQRNHIQNMDSETDFSSNSDYDELANEILFVGDIVQPFQFEPVFTAAEIQKN